MKKNVIILNIFLNIFVYIFIYKLVYLILNVGRCNNDDDNDIIIDIKQ